MDATIYNLGAHRFREIREQLQQELEEYDYSEEQKQEFWTGFYSAYQNG